MVTLPFILFELFSLELCPSQKHLSMTILYTLKTSGYDVIFDFCVDSASLAMSLEKCNVIMI